MRALKTSTNVAVVLAFFLALPCGAYAQRDIIVPDISASAGADIVIPIYIDDASGMAGAEVTLTFDPTILTASGARTTSLTDGFFILFNLGQDRISVSIMNATGLGSGSGSFIEVLATVDPSAVACSASPLSLENTALFDEAGITMPITRQNGTFTVSPCAGRVVSVPDISASAGADIVIPVNIDDATGIGGIEITLVYDPEILIIPQGTEGEDAARATSLTTGFFVLANTNTPGRISITAARTTSLSGGSGALVEIWKCTVDPSAIPCGTSPLTLQSVALFDATGTPLLGTITKQDGTFDLAPADEVCDGFDNDCDDEIDEELTGSPCPLQEGVCAGSTQTCGGDAGWLECDASTYGVDYESSETTCDGLDNDCDGIPDNGGDALCNDSAFCNGAETCDGLAGCQAGTPPCSPPEACDEDTDQCEGTAETMVRIEPVEMSGGCDAELMTAAVVVEDVVDLHNVTFDISFDPSVVNIAGCEEGPLLGQAGETIFLSEIDNTTGHVNAANALLGNDPGVSGCGVLAYLTLEVIDRDALPASLCFENIALEGHMGGLIVIAGTGCGSVANPHKGDVDASGYIDYVDLFDFVFDWHLGCADEGYCAINDYNDDCYIDYNDLFDFVFDWHTGAHLAGPDGGEVCSGTEEVTWEGGSIADAPLLIDLYASTDGGACWHQVTADEVDDGSYMWDTTAWPDSAECKLKIVAHNEPETYEDESDGVFTISNGGSPDAVSSLQMKREDKGRTSKHKRSRPRVKSQLKVRPETIRRVGKDSEVEILIEVSKAKDLHNISFDIKFDPEAVSVVSCGEGDLLRKAGKTVFLPDIDNETGNINIANAVLGQVAGASGRGVVAKITFKVEKPDMLPVNLILKSPILQDSQGKDVR